MSKHVHCFSLAPFDAVLRDDEELHTALTKRFGPLDLGREWEKLSRNQPIAQLLWKLPEKSLRVAWQQTRETTERYLNYHYKYALLPDVVALASSRHVMAIHLRGHKPLLDGAFEFIERKAARLSAFFPA